MMFLKYLYKKITNNLCENVEIFNTRVKHKLSNITSALILLLLLLSLHYYDTCITCS